MHILQMSFQAGLLILAIIIIRRVALNKLPKTMFLALWGVALLRLLVPFSFSSPFSIYSVISSAIGSSPSSAPALVGAVISPGAEPARAAASAEHAAAFSVSPIAVVWLAGMLALLVFFAVWYIRSYRTLRCSIPVQGNPLVDKWAAEHKRLRPLAVLQSDRVTTPLATGLIRPRIILPKTVDMSDTRLLQYVLTHEYFHIRRWDMLWKLLLLCAVCVHWFNPLVWVMLLLSNRDLEITCDEMVLRHFGADTKSAYAYSLIRMAERRSNFSPLYSDFSRNTAKERITAIMKYKKSSIISIIAAVILTAGITTAFAATAPNDNVMPQDVITDWAQYDGNGNLIYYHTVDENGNDVYLDYEPEKPKGDAELDGLCFISETIDCIDGIAGEHREANGRMAVYTNNGGAWSLERGQVVTFTFSVKAIKDRDIPQGITFGYLKDGVYMEYTESVCRLQGESSFTFTAPEDGDYNFFWINASSDTIYVNCCSISA